MCSYCLVCAYPGTWFWYRWVQVRVHPRVRVPIPGSHYLLRRAAGWGRVWEPRQGQADEVHWSWLLFQRRPVTLHLLCKFDVHITGLTRWSAAWQVHRISPHLALESLLSSSAQYSSCGVETNVVEPHLVDTICWKGSVPDVNCQVWNLEPVCLNIFRTHSVFCSHFVLCSFWSIPRFELWIMDISPWLASHILYHIDFVCSRHSNVYCFNNNLLLNSRYN